MKFLFAAAVLSALVTSCTVCRQAAIRDAEQYSMQGYEVRIATYELKLDGLLRSLSLDAPRPSPGIS